MASWGKNDTTISAMDRNSRYVEYEKICRMFKFSHCFKNKSTPLSHSSYYTLPLPVTVRDEPGTERGFSVGAQCTPRTETLAISLPRQFS